MFFLWLFEIVGATTPPIQIFYLYIFEMDDIQRDQNLMLVYATEGYAKRHGISESEAFSIFKKYGVNSYLRKYYGVLHTQDFDEDVFFAEDLIERAKEKQLLN